MGEGGKERRAPLRSCACKAYEGEGELGESPSVHSIDASLLHRRHGVGSDVATSWRLDLERCDARRGAEGALLFFAAAFFCERCFFSAADGGPGGWDRVGRVGEWGIRLYT